MKRDIGLQDFDEIEDARFRNLVGAEDWLRLPPRIRMRFGKRVRGGESIVYQGQVRSMTANWAGRLLAHAARLVGSPLPFDETCVGQPAVVIVTEDAEGQGQFWIRQYGRRSGFPQMVHSSKRFGGPTGLEEYIGFGIGIALRVEVAKDTLFFKSDHYFLRMHSLRVGIPKALGPGRMIIGHRDLGHGRFRFSLSLRSRLFGELLSQEIDFQDGADKVARGFDE